MDVPTFHAQRRFVSTPSGRIAYVEQGEGPAALFVHGVPLNGFHWRHVMAGMSDIRHCIALDLMGLGYTEISPTQDVSFPAQARMIAQFLDALKLDRVDLVGNDSGGAIAQIFAAHHPERLRTLTLTNCDVHDGWPPQAILPAIEAARQGTLANSYQQLLENPEAARARFARAWADPSVLTDEVLRVYLQPLLATQERRANFHRYWIAFDSAQTVAIEPQLRALRVPTLIVWALNDIFFDVKWARWLVKTIPGVVRLVEVPGAKLFFPEDRPDALVPLLRALLTAAEAGELPERIPAADRYARSRVRTLDTEMAYVDTGRGDPVVFLHGNPASSYLWRNVMPPVEPVARCLAPDLVGMGESGRAPAGGYRFLDHARYLDAWFEALGLRRNVVLVGHDWGAALAFHWARRHPDRVAGLIYMEAFVRPLTWAELPERLRTFFRFVRSPAGEDAVLKENFLLERILAGGSLRKLSDAELTRYRRPYLEPGESRRPMLAWPREVPFEGEPADVESLMGEYAKWLLTSPVPKLFVNAEPGSLLVGAPREFCRRWPNQEEVTVRAAHVLQEDAPAEIGRAIAAFVVRIRRGNPRLPVAG